MKNEPVSKSHSAEGPRAVPLFKEMAETWFEGKKVNAGKNAKPVKETTLDHWKTTRIAISYLRLATGG